MTESDDLSIKTTLKKIEDTKKLKTEQALALANEVASGASAALSNAEREKDFSRMEELARLAESAYLLASTKVPRQDGDLIAFASTYWSLRADHARLDAQLAEKTPSQPAPAALEATGRKELREVFKRGRGAQLSSHAVAEVASKGMGFSGALFVQDDSERAVPTAADRTRGWMIAVGTHGWRASFPGPRPSEQRAERRRPTNQVGRSVTDPRSAIEGAPDD